MTPDKRTPLRQGNIYMPPKMGWDIKTSFFTLPPTDCFLTLDRYERPLSQTGRWSQMGSNFLPYVSLPTELNGCPEQFISTF